MFVAQHGRSAAADQDIEIDAADAASEGVG